MFLPSLRGGERRGFGGGAPISPVRLCHRVILGFSIEFASPLLFRRDGVGCLLPSTGKLLSASPGVGRACNVTYSSRSKRSERAQSKLTGGYPSQVPFTGACRSLLRKPFRCS